MSELLNPVNSEISKEYFGRIFLIITTTKKIKQEYSNKFDILIIDK